MFGYLWRVEKEKSERKQKWKFNVEIFTLFDVKMIQIWTFPADPSTERVLSLAERVAYLRRPINLRLLNWRVPALVVTPTPGAPLTEKISGFFTFRLIERVAPQPPSPHTVS